jgi:hypothetical protein
MSILRQQQDCRFDAGDLDNVVASRRVKTARGAPPPRAATTTKMFNRRVEPEHSCRSPRRRAERIGRMRRRCFERP